MDKTENNTTVKPLFRDIAADDDTPEISEIESLCVECEENVSRNFLELLGTYHSTPDVFEVCKNAFSYLIRF